MIHLSVQEPAVMDMLTQVYANRLNATSRFARYAMNRKKRDFKEAFRLAAKVVCTEDDNRIDTDLIIAVYHFCIPRADWDAGVKSVQDACEHFIGCKSDRIIKTACCFVTRPAKAKKGKPERLRGVDAYLYCMRTELQEAMEKIECLSKHSQSCWL